MATRDMATVIIKSKSKAAKQMLEFLKTQSYAIVIEDKEPNAGVQRSLDEAKAGKVIRAKNVDELIYKLKQ